MLRRYWWIPVLAVALAVVAVIVLPLGDGRIGEMRDLSNWPRDCRTKTQRPSKLAEARKWTTAVETASTVCEFDGPALTYARFKNASALAATVKRLPPEHSYCSANNELVETSFGFVNLDDKRALALLCKRLHGRLVFRKIDLHDLV